MRNMAFVAAILASSTFGPLVSAQDLATVQIVKVQKGNDEITVQVGIEWAQGATKPKSDEITVAFLFQEKPGALKLDASLLEKMGAGNAITQLKEGNVIVVRDTADPQARRSGHILQVISGDGKDKAFDFRDNDLFTMVLPTRRAAAFELSTDSIHVGLFQETDAKKWQQSSTSYKALSKVIPVPASSQAQVDKSGAKKETLVAALVAKGNAALEKKNRDAAVTAYEFAVAFGAKNEDIQDKLAAARKLKGDDFLPLGNRFDGTRAILNMPVKLFGPWPRETTPAMDLAALRILSEDKLVGDLVWGDSSRSTAGHPSSGVFVATPKMKIEDVVKNVGAPAEKMTDEKTGNSVYDYGRIRIIADKGGAVVAVYCRP